LPRSKYVQEGEEGVYHCFSRCVRQAFLYGFDPYTGRDFSHRKGWIEDRLRQLASILVIDVCAYSVMGNHYHTVLRTRPDIADTWSDYDVASRWLTLCPKRSGYKKAARLPVEEQIQAARALSAEAIMEGVQKERASFWPVPVGATILENPYTLFETGNFNDTPILVGTNSHEGRLFSPQEFTGAQFEQMIRESFAEGADDLLKAYPHANDAEATRAVQDIRRDSIFAWPTWAWASLQSRIGKNDAYVYYYDHCTVTMPDGADHAS
jgi:hypothetical protein